MLNHLLMDKVFPADLGFGYGKAKFKNKEYKQPSVIGEPRRVHEQDIQGNDIQIGKITLTDDKHEVFTPEHFVGDLALRHSNTRYYSIGDNKANIWTTWVQLDSMLGTLAPNEDIFLITGLPLDFYFEQMTSMHRMLDNYRNPKKISLKFGKSIIKDANISINDYHIVPQPIGACMNYLLDERGQFIDKNEARQIIIVGDLGFHTFDLLVYDGGEIHRFSHSETDISVANGYRLVQEWLKPKVASIPDLYTLDAAMLKGEYQGIDLTGVLSKMCESIAQQIRFAIDSLNIKYHKYIGTGGWSSLITPLLNIAPEKIQVYGQDGNINGYAKIGVRKCLV